MGVVSVPAEASGREAADPAALVGRVLVDRYRVVGLLGVGGIGRVYRAEHLILRRPVAIKVLLEHYQCVPELSRRFEREAMALAALSHPNIVTITDFVATRDLTFLVMELIEGEELVALLERGPMDVNDAFGAMEQILSSLAYAHERDVIHRDLKPQNVLVRRLPGGKLHAEILDFGLAKFMDGSGPAANLTKTGLVVGTPAYMAPEQASGSHADQRADVYAAGLMFFEMLAGSHPFEGAEGTELLRHHLLSPPPTLASRCPGARIAPELEVFLQRALAKAGADRYANGAAMLEAFLALPPDAFVPGAERKARSTPREKTAFAHTKPALPESTGASGPRAQAKPKRRRRMLSALGLLVLFGGALAIASSMLDHRENGPPEFAAIAGVSEDEALALAAQEQDDHSELSEEELEAQAEAEEGLVADGHDPSLDEPADAPLEEEEEEEPESEAKERPPVARPPARNPWAGREPATLALVRRRISRNQTITKRHMRQLTNYRRRNPGDVRAVLVLAQVYASRNWLTSALQTYRRAYRRDPSARGDVRMMRDLIRIAGTESLHREGTSALVEIYGSEVRRPLERAIARERDPETRARLEAALAAISD